MMDTKLERLLLKNKFSDLSFEEREYVLSHIKEEDYIKLRVLLLNSKQVFNKEYDELQLNKDLKTNLNVAFRKKFKKQYFFSNIQNIRPFNNAIIKPSLVIAGFLVLFTLSFNFYKNNTLQSDIEEVTTYLLHENHYNENLNLYYSADRLKNNLKIADTLKSDYLEMNKYLKPKTPGLITSFQRQ